MKKRLLFATFAGLTLVSAAPSDPIPWEDEDSLRGYPPCSASVTDRCIQTYERGVATAANRSRNEELGRDGPAAPRDDYAARPAREARSDYPPCSASVTDRCIQTGSRSAVRHARAHAPKRKHQAARTQLAMRAGERG